MTNILPDPVRLTRHDAERNMARFYLLAIEPTLFGDVALIRRWGRIGTRGRVMLETFRGMVEADGARAKLERAKRRRGYAEGPT